VKQTVRLGRVAGIPVGAHWSVGVILAIIAELLAVTVLPGAFPHERAGQYWAVAGAAAVAFLASLLAHELAHALVARRRRCGGGRRHDRGTAGRHGVLLLSSAAGQRAYDLCRTIVRSSGGRGW
jgi:Zn-dependent protease